MNDLQNNITSKAKKHRAKLFAKLRAYFFTGILVTAPLGLTIYVVWVVVNFVDTRIKAIIPSTYHPETYLPFKVPGLGLVFVLVGLTIIGALSAGVFGRYFVHLSEKLVNRMPIVRSVYSAVKQIIETVFSQQSSSFREVVMIEYPRKGIWSLGFLTGKTKGEVQELTDDEVLNVFIPTTPNPTSGFLLFVPKQDVHHLNMSVEEGIKMIVSAGILTPDFHPPLPSDSS